MARVLNATLNEKLDKVLANQELISKAILIMNDKITAISAEDGEFEELMKTVGEMATDPNGLLATMFGGSPPLEGNEE